jgi:Zn-dependent peptidase ImmA (M78 family)
MRFTLAHELGHLIMHRFPSPMMEEEANAFASALLMPASDVKPYFLGRKIDLALLASLKPEWKVAMQSILVRATTLEFVTKNQAQYLWKQINARRLRLREPPELDFQAEVPTVITTMVRVHMEALGYAPSELAKLLHVRESDLRYFYGLVTPAQPRPRFTVMK